MTDRLVPRPGDDLEARLADLASVLDFPPTPDLASGVGARLRGRPASDAAPRDAAPRPSVRRSLPRALLLAAALVLALVGGVVAVRYGLELLSIESGPLPTVSPGPSGRPSPSPAASDPLGTGLGLGLATDLDAIADDVAFPVLVPAALGPPDAVYLGGAALRGQVAFVYAARDDLPASRLLDGAGLLVTQNLGATDQGLAHKLADTRLATVEPVDVDGAPGVWISGEPHFFWYLAPSGAIIEDSRRLVGDTLVWERDGVLYRIEGAIDLERALAIARSMR